MTEIPPLVSVCIANYNGMAVIDDCIRSVLAQEGNISVEILVHDDASTDGSVAHIRDHYPDAKLIISEDNVGFCVANNRMVAETKGEYLLLLNNDAALFPDALQTLLSEARLMDRPAILGLPQYDATGSSLIDIGSRFDPFLNPVPNQDRHNTDSGMVIGACLWIPKSLWVELKGFPEWFHTLAEDMYLCCRARLLGYYVRAIASSGFRHKVGNSLGGGKITARNRLVTSRRRRQLSERNKTFVMVLIYPAPLFQIVFPIHIVLLVFEGIALSIAKLDWALLLDVYIECLKSLWKERKRLSSQRKMIQVERRISLTQFCSAFRIFPHKLRLLFRHGLPHVY